MQTYFGVTRTPARLSRGHGHFKIDRQDLIEPSSSSHSRIRFSHQVFTGATYRLGALIIRPFIVRPPLLSASTPTTLPPY
eukprot:2738707-Pyramimonas_sp.AAC.1